MFEKLGKTSRTVDKGKLVSCLIIYGISDSIRFINRIFCIADLETQIEFLRDTQKKYTNLLKLTKVLSSHFNHVVQVQVSEKFQYSTPCAIF